MIVGPLFNRFTFGEVSPLLWARGDLSKYAAGCREMVNFIPLLQGPATRRGGTRFIAKANNGSEPVALLRFARDESDTFVIEAGDGYLRFYKNGAPVTGPGGTPYQAASPWRQADLFDAHGICALKYVQSADVMWIVCPTRPPWKLMRYGDADWRLEVLDGWGDRPNAKCVTLWRERLCLAAGNTVYMSQAGAFGNFEVAVRSVPGATGTFAKGPYNIADPPVVIDNTAGTIVYSFDDGQGTAGTVTVGFPADEAGASLVGGGGYRILASDPKKGVSRIGFVADGKYLDEPLWGHTSANTLTGLLSAAGRGGYNGSRMDLRVDPQKTGIYTDGAATTSDGTVRGYIVRGAEAAIAADDPVEIDVYSDTTDDIEWLCPSSSLLAGTSSGELIIGETTAADPFGPENCKVAPETAFGSAPIQPLRVGSVIIFAQRAGRKLREFVYDYAGDNYLALDVTVAAEHITRGGVTSLAWQSEPVETLWATRPDGQLVGFTYSKDQDMSAWHRHKLGGEGKVSQIAVIPAAHGGRDELWLSVRRVVQGRTVYYIERMEEGHIAGEPLAEAFFLDAGLTARGAGLTRVTGLAHLEGQEVAILADGGVQPPQIVTRGAISLKYPADVVQAGLAYASRLTTVNLDIPMQDGSVQGRVKRIVSAALRLVESMGGAAGRDPDQLERLEYRRGNDAMDGPPALMTGDVRVPWPHGHETDGRLTVVQEYPLPFTLAAIIAEVAVEGRN